MNLKVLIIKNNSLATIPLLSNLEVLDASHNSLISLDSLSKKIKELFVGHNSLTDLPALPGLITGDLSYNKLSDLSGLTNAYNLQTLNASYNLFNSPGFILSQIKNCNLLNLDLRGMELNKSNYESFVNTFPAIEKFNGDSVLQREDSNKKHGASLRASPCWDFLSKSKIFPSCRSSLAEIEKNSPKNSALNDYFMFSDIKPDASLKSSINYTSRQIEYQDEDSSQTLAQDSEYQLLAKELEINKRIRKLDLETRKLGDSLISKDDGETHLKLGLYRRDSDSSRRKNSFAKDDEKFADSLISKRNSGSLKDIANSDKDERFKDKKNISIDKFTDIDKIENFENDKIEKFEKIEKIEKIEKFEKFEKIEEIPERLDRQERIDSLNTAERKNKQERKNKLEIEELQEIKEKVQLKNHKNPLLARRDSNETKDYKSFEKEDFTISFEISNDLSKEKPIREPLKPIYDNHKSKKSHCCKHCCKKRKRSINLQTSLKDDKKVEKQTLITKFIDQATSPMNSLINCTPLRLKQKFVNPESEFKEIEEFPRSSSRKSDYFINEIPIYSQKQTYDYTETPVSYEGKKMYSENPIFSQRNRSFISEVEKDRKSPVSLYEKRALTPLISYRNNYNKPLTDINQLISYACTPPRPILASEANTPLICNLSSKGTEFFLISQIFIFENKRIKQVTKAYTYSLQKNMQMGLPETFLHKGIETENMILFYSGPANELETICKSSEGFSVIYKNNPKELYLTSTITQPKKSKNNNFILITLVNSKTTFQVKENLFQLSSLQKIIPIYLVEFN